MLIGGGRNVALLAVCAPGGFAVARPVAGDHAGGVVLGPVGVTAVPAEP